MEKVQQYSDASTLPRIDVEKTCDQVAKVVVAVVDLTAYVALLFFLTISIVGIPIIVIYSQEFKERFTWIMNGGEKTPAKDLEEKPIAPPLAQPEPIPPPSIQPQPIVENGKPIGSEWVKAFCNVLVAHGHPRTYDTTLLDANPSSLTIADYFTNLREKVIEENNRFIFIPLILKEATTEHLVVFVIDAKEKTFEYYDPMGGLIENEKRKIKNLGNFSPSEFQKKIVEKYPSFKFISPIEQKEKISKADSDNYLCWFMLQRGCHKNLAEYHADPKPSIEEINNRLTEEIDTAPKKSNTVPEKKIQPKAQPPKEIKVTPFVPTNPIEPKVTLKDIVNSSKKVVAPLDEGQIETKIEELVQIARSGKHEVISIPLLLETNDVVTITLYRNPVPFTIKYYDKENKPHYDTKLNNTLEYYDPRGGRLFDERKVIRHLNMTPADFVSLISPLLGCSVNQSSKIYQRENQNIAESNLVVVSKTTNNGFKEVNDNLQNPILIRGETQGKVKNPTLIGGEMPDKVQSIKEIYAHPFNIYAPSK